MWKNGCVEIDGQLVYFEAKVYDEGSAFGVGNGRVSKLTLDTDDGLLAHYDRGWDVRPVNDLAKQALTAVLEKFDGADAHWDEDE